MRHPQPLHYSHWTHLLDASFLQHGGFILPFQIFGGLVLVSGLLFVPVKRSEKQMKFRLDAQDRSSSSIPCSNSSSITNIGAVLRRSSAISISADINRNTKHAN